MTWSPWCFSGDDKIEDTQRRQEARAEAGWLEAVLVPLGMPLFAPAVVACGVQENKPAPRQPASYKRHIIPWRHVAKLAL